MKFQDCNKDQMAIGLSFLCKHIHGYYFISTKNLEIGLIYGSAFLTSLRFCIHLWIVELRKQLSKINLIPNYAEM